MHPFPAPELRTKNFTDTRIFLNKGGWETLPENPSPKNGFGRPPPPPSVIQFPPHCSRPGIFIRGNGHRPDQSHFLSPPKPARSFVRSPPPPKNRTIRLPPPPLTHPTAKGVRQKEFGKKGDEKKTEASEKVAEIVPKTRKSDRTPFADHLFRRPD